MPEEKDPKENLEGGSNPKEQEPKTPENMAEDIRDAGDKIENTGKKAVDRANEAAEGAGDEAKKAAGDLKEKMGKTQEEAADVTKEALEKIKEGKRNRADKEAERAKIIAEIKEMEKKKKAEEEERDLRRDLEAKKVKDEKAAKKAEEDQGIVILLEDKKETHPYLYFYMSGKSAEDIKKEFERLKLDINKEVSWEIANQEAHDRKGRRNDINSVHEMTASEALELYNDLWYQPNKNEVLRIKGVNSFEELQRLAGKENGTENMELSAKVKTALNDLLVHKFLSEALLRNRSGITIPKEQIEVLKTLSNLGVFDLTHKETDIKKGLKEGFRFQSVFDPLLNTEELMESIEKATSLPEIKNLIDEFKQKIKAEEDKSKQDTLTPKQTPGKKLEGVQWNDAKTMISWLFNRSRMSPQMAENLFGLTDKKTYAKLVGMLVDLKIAKNKGKDEYVLTLLASGPELNNLAQAIQSSNSFEEAESLIIKFKENLKKKKIQTAVEKISEKNNGGKLAYPTISNMFSGKEEKLVELFDQNSLNIGSNHDWTALEEKLQKAEKDAALEKAKGEKEQELDQKEAKEKKTFDTKAIAETIKEKIKNNPDWERLSEEEKNKIIAEMIIAARQEFNEQTTYGKIEKTVTNFFEWWDNLDQGTWSKIAKRGVSAFLIGASALITANYVEPIKNMGTKLLIRTAAAVGLTAMVTLASGNAKKRQEVNAIQNENAEDLEEIKKKGVALKRILQIGGIGASLVFGGPITAGVALSAMLLKELGVEAINKKIEEAEKKMKGLKVDNVENFKEGSDGYDPNKMLANIEAFDKQFTSLTKKQTWNRVGKYTATTLISVGAGAGSVWGSTYQEAHELTTHDLLKDTSVGKIADKYMPFFDRHHQDKNDLVENNNKLEGANKELSKINDETKSILEETKGSRTTETQGASGVGTGGGVEKLEKVNEYAVIDGKQRAGITYAFRDQLRHDNALAQKLGVDPNKLGDPKYVAKITKELAIKTGYMDEAGHEIRVSAPGKVAYELSVDANGNPTVQEIELTKQPDGTFLGVRGEVHNTGTAFEQDIEKQYEYSDGKIHHYGHKTEVKGGYPAPDQETPAFDTEAPQKGSGLDNNTELGLTEKQKALEEAYRQNENKSLKNFLERKWERSEIENELAEKLRARYEGALNIDRDLDFFIHKYPNMTVGEANELYEKVEARIYDIPSRSEWEHINMASIKMGEKLSADEFLKINTTRNDDFYRLYSEDDNSLNRERYESAAKHLRKNSDLGDFLGRMKNENRLEPEGGLLKRKETVEDYMLRNYVKAITEGRWERFKHALWEPLRGTRGSGSSDFDSSNTIEQNTGAQEGYTAPTDEPNVEKMGPASPTGGVNAAPVEEKLQNMQPATPTGRNGFTPQENDTDIEKMQPIQRTKVEKQAPEQDMRPATPKTKDITPEIKKGEMEEMGPVKNNDMGQNETTGAKEIIPETGITAKRVKLLTELKKYGLEKNTTTEAEFGTRPEEEVKGLVKQLMEKKEATSQEAVNERLAKTGGRAEIISRTRFSVPETTVVKGEPALSFQERFSKWFAEQPKGKGRTGTFEGKLYKLEYSDDPNYKEPTSSPSGRPSTPDKIEIKYKNVEGKNN